MTRRCGVDDQLCCSDAEACLSDSCVTLGTPCESTDDCDIAEICLVSLMRCVPRDAVEVCEFRPPVGEFSPTVACRWTPAGIAHPESDDVVMTPSVANMTDDNEDGVTDTDDIPDVVFISFDRQADGAASARGYLRVVSGLCNDDGTMRTHATLEMPLVGNSSGVALGNLHPDSMESERAPEIVATIKRGGGGMPSAGVVAWRRTAADGSAWEIMWRNDNVLDVTRSAGGIQPSLLDVDADGSPEVLVGNVVLNGQTGAVIWDGDVTVGTEAGIGHNAFLGPVSTAADLDLDGQIEVIAGNTVYDARTGAEIWTYALPASRGGACSAGVRGCDGYPAVGNFDDDPEGEVVLIRQGEAFVLEHDGTLKSRILLPSDNCRNGAGEIQNESGPPTIADFDGDGRPEIGTAGADYYIVVDLDCDVDPLPAGCDSRGILWKVDNFDCSSRATGSSVFDFEGDGAAEVVYADETTFRIFDGATGRILYEDATHSSNTRMEMPIVVDVDNDGKSEVIVPEPNPDPALGGIEIWEDTDNNWVRTRRIWNQHAYHVTNISEDGQVPRTETPNWSEPRLNNFRQNVQPGGLFDAPDLVVIDVELESCAASGTAIVAVTVGNRGALGVAAGVPVIAYATPDGGAETLIGLERTSRFLLPGQEERILFTYTPAGGWSFSTFTVRARVDDDGMGGATYNECDETNNEGTTTEPLRTCGIG